MHAWQQIRRIGPFGTIVLLHVVFFYALQSGLLCQAAQTLPNEVFAAFITPQHASEPAQKPQPAMPKTVPVTKQAVVSPASMPAPNTAPSEQAITAPSTPQLPAAAAPVPAMPAQPKTISSGVEYLQAPQPEYPAIARRMKEEGKVVLRVLVNEKGRAESIEIQKTSGSARLDEAARQAVQRAVFKPYTEDGKAVAVYAIVPIKFQLD